MTMTVIDDWRVKISNKYLSCGQLFTGKLTKGDNSDSRVKLVHHSSYQNFVIGQRVTLSQTSPGFYVSAVQIF